MGGVPGTITLNAPPGRLPSAGRRSRMGEGDARCLGGARDGGHGEEAGDRAIGDDLGRSPHGLRTAMAAKSGRDDEDGKEADGGRFESRERGRWAYPGSGAKRGSRSGDTGHNSLG